ncbi:restriction endonuclease [Chitinophaga sp. CB10]|uniref:restriction endonuclease n=1 Tax=Chitinophaga sp. CB10 TaxID=1891659 RepID=UPI0025B7F66E|nr:restriction endonuclease [Chitinophaga sp. CB10]
MKNPKWHKDEIILALDLYFSPDRGSIDSKNPKIHALSKTLNNLPLFEAKPDENKFRNVNAVALKLANFTAFDENYPGKGLTRGSKLDGELFNYFKSRRKELKD